MQIKPHDAFGQQMMTNLQVTFVLMLHHQQLLEVTSVPFGPMAM